MERLTSKNSNLSVDSSELDSASLQKSQFLSLNSQFSLGFSAIGVAKAEPVEEAYVEKKRRWLAAGKAGEMAYLSNHFDIRCDPRLLLPGAQSIVSVALNYYPKKKLSDSQYAFATYAYGKDYHDVMRQRLQVLLDQIKAQYPEIEGRICCDTAPIWERYWAWRAGLGWIGRNEQLIIPHHGSYYVLGELLLTFPFDTYDVPLASHCGNCHKCEEACPSGALKDGELNASRCLSYLTIEKRGELPPEAAAQMGRCIYGCDRCLEVCPHNRFASPTDVTEFMPSEAFLAMRPADWQALTEEQYRTLFKGSAVKRAKYAGLMRNIEAAEHH